VRFWLDDDRLIDEWHDSAEQTYSREVYVAAGGHNLRVEYYQGRGDAMIGFTYRPAGVSWVGNLYTCMAPQDSWIKVYRLTPDNVWEDRKRRGGGRSMPAARSKSTVLPIDPYYGTAGQPYKVELWVDSKVVQNRRRHQCRPAVLPDRAWPGCPHILAVRRSDRVKGKGSAGVGRIANLPYNGHP